MNLRSGKPVPRLGNRGLGSKLPITPFSSERTAQVASYPCVYCDQRMYTDETVDFGPIVDKDGIRKPTKYHRKCKETNDVQERSDSDGSSTSGSGVVDEPSR